jgi:hypothetical protein
MSPSANKDYYYIKSTWSSVVIDNRDFNSGRDWSLLRVGCGGRGGNRVVEFFCVAQKGTNSLFRGSAKLFLKV